MSTDRPIATTSTPGTCQCAKCTDECVCETCTCVACECPTCNHKAPGARG